MTERFCTSCQAMRSIKGGVLRQANKTSRWICQPCVEHKTESIYKSRGDRPCDVPRLMEKLYRRAA